MSSYRKNGKLFPDYYYTKDECDTDTDFNKYQKEILNNLPDEVILPPNKTFNLKITYPLTNPFVCELNSGNKGLTRRQVIEFVIKCYKQIYKEEDKSTKVKTGLVPGLYNRNETNGKYGIWGHDMSDLMLHTLEVCGNNLGVSCDS